MASVNKNFDAWAIEVKNSTQQKSPGTPRDGSRVLVSDLTFLFWSPPRNEVFSRRRALVNLPR